MPALKSSPARTWLPADFLPEQLIAEDLQSRLAGKTLIGRRIQTLQTTSSTNDEIEKAAQAGEAEGLLCLLNPKTRDEVDWDANGLPQPGVVFGFGSAAPCPHRQRMHSVNGCSRRQSRSCNPSIHWDSRRN